MNPEPSTMFANDPARLPMSDALSRPWTAGSAGPDPELAALHRGRMIRLVLGGVWVTLGIAAVVIGFDTLVANAP